jgi:hypothetical protein
VTKSNWLTRGWFPSPTVAARRSMSAMRHRAPWRQHTTSNSPSSGLPGLLTRRSFAIRATLARMRLSYSSRAPQARPSSTGASSVKAERRASVPWTLVLAAVVRAGHRCARGYTARSGFNRISTRWLVFLPTVSLWLSQSGRSSWLLERTKRGVRIAAIATEGYAIPAQDWSSESDRRCESAFSQTLTCPTATV